MILVKGDRRKGSQFSPNKNGFWFWLKGISERDLSLAQPHTRLWVRLKRIVVKIEFQVNQILRRPVLFIFTKLTTQNLCFISIVINQT
jgi:hypothetical protein